MAAAAPLEQQSIAQQLNVPEMMAETAATKATLDQYVAALHQKIEASEPSDAKEVAKPAAAAEAATTVQTLIDQRIVDKLDGYQAPPTPHMLASSQAQLEDRMKEANKKLIEVRERYHGQACRELTLECIAQGEPLKGPELESDFDASKMTNALQRVGERRAALHASLASLKATATDLTDLKQTIDGKRAALEKRGKENCGNGDVTAAAPAVVWPLPADVATPETADEASLRAETERCKAHIAAQSQAQELVRAKKAELKERIAAMEAAAAPLQEAVTSLEAEVTEALEDVDTEQLKQGQDGDPHELKRKRGEEIADMVARNQDTAEGVEWFRDLTACCETLAGVKLIGTENVATEEGAGTCSDAELPPILVRLLLWGRHTLTLTLSQTQSAGPWRRDVLSGAHLEANFDGFDERTEDGEDDSSDESLPRWRCMMRAMGAEKSTSSSSSSSSPVVAVEDLLLLARTLPAGDDVKLVVREVAARVARAPARFRHLALLETNRGFVVNPTMQGAVVTLPTGIVATVRLSPDYPIAAPAIEGTTTAISESPSPAGLGSGAVLLESLVGTYWRDAELAAVRDSLNARQQWHFLDDLFEALEKEIADAQETLQPADTNGNEQ